MDYMNMSDGEVHRARMKKANMEDEWQNNNTQKSKPANFSTIFILLLAFSVYYNWGKWKAELIKYYGGLIEDPRKIFHFETALYLFLTFLAIRFLFRFLMKRVF